MRGSEAEVKLHQKGDFESEVLVWEDKCDCALKVVARAVFPFWGLEYKNRS